MFANINLQLPATSPLLDTAVEQPPSGSTSGLPGDPLQSPFSTLLGMRVNLELAARHTGGEGLPDSGKELPVLPLPEVPPELAILAEGGHLNVDSLGENLSVDRSAEFVSVGLPAEPVSVDLSAELVPGSGQTTQLPIGSNLPENTVQTLAAGADGIPQYSNAKHGDVLVSAQADTTLSERSRQPAIVQANVVATLPAGQTAVAVPVADILPREKTPQPTTTVLKADPGTSPGTIKLADMPADNLVAAFARSGARVEAQGAPNERISSATFPQSATSHHLSATLTSAAGDSGSTRFPTTLDAVRTPTAFDSIRTPVGNAAWGERLGERVLMLSGSQVRTAEIRLTPADLGPLRVQIGVEDGAANVTFQAQHAVTREAIEQAMPRLREMLAESGLSLGQTDVSEQHVADGKSDRESAPAESGRLADEESDPANISDSDTQRKTVTGSNLLDTFV